MTNVMGRKMFFFCCNKIEAKHLINTKDTSKWFLFVDVDYFKVINDTFGHSTGDDVLREIAARLTATFREISYIGRIDGDEFVFPENHAYFIHG